MALQVARLREILKDCNKAIRASRIALKDGPKHVNLASLWQHTDLTRVLTEMTQSTKIDKANSLGKFVRPVIDAIRHGSGTAKTSKVTAQQNGETSSGQSKKVKVRAEKAAPGERPSKKTKGKKQDKGAKASEALLQSIAEEHGASTSEDSD